MSDHLAGDLRTNQKRMLAGGWYIADDLENGRRSQRAVQLADAHHRAAVANETAARPLLVMLLGDLGGEVSSKPPPSVDYGENISGERTFINCNFTGLDVAPIRVCADCQVGPNVQFLIAIHPVDIQARLANLGAGEPITTSDNVRLGGGAIVLPGMTIGDDAVVGAGAVATKDLPANVVAIGNRARIIEHI